MVVNFLVKVTVNALGRRCKPQSVNRPAASVGNQRPIMSRMLTEFEAKFAREVKEISITQTDGEFEQVMSRWKIRV